MGHLFSGGLGNAGAGDRIPWSPAAVTSGSLWAAKPVKAGQDKLPFSKHFLIY